MEKRPKEPFRILAIDDDEDMLGTYQTILRHRYTIETAASGNKGLAHLKEQDVDLVILDLYLPDRSGLELIKQIKALDPSPEVIMVTAIQDIKLAVQAMKLGAYDYVNKPFEVDELLSLIEKGLEKRKLRKENLTLQAIVGQPELFSRFIGTSPPIQNLLHLANQVAKNDSTVLLLGESGTGKELVAHLIHEKSRRAHHPFIAINCAAIPENLIEPELFGHEKGAFTHAYERRLGKFELAHQGTLFLDEIASTPASMQAKMLRVLQNKIIERVGGGKAIPVDVRLISATNVDLKQLVLEQKFREDLYYRLNVIPLEIPPLRRRQEDIPLLIQFFLERFNRKFQKTVRGFTEEAERKMLEFYWPGNVRELENTLERVVAFAESELISLDLLPREIIAGEMRPGAPTENFKHSVSEFERQQVLKALQENQWNQTRAAKQLGIHRTTFVSKMQTYGISRYGVTEDKSDDNYNKL